MDSVFSTVLPDLDGNYRITMDVWGESPFSTLLLCSQGRATGTSQGGVWKPLPQQGRLTGRPEWCTLTFTVSPDLLAKETRRQSFCLGDADSQIWAAKIRVEAESKEQLR